LHHVGSPRTAGSYRGELRHGRAGGTPAAALQLRASCLPRRAEGLLEPATPAGRAAAARAGRLALLNETLARVHAGDDLVLWCAACSGFGAHRNSPA
jgi:hypothetical protein